MTCEECRDNLVQYHLETLDEGEREQVLAHLQSGCADCVEYLSQVRSTLEALPLGLVPEPMSEAAADRLMARVRSSGGAGHRTRRVTPPEPANRPSRFRRLAEAFAAGAVAATITAAVFWNAFDRERKSVAGLRDELARTQQSLDQLQSTVRVTDEAVKLLQSPAVQLVSLQGTQAQPRAKARVLWDTERGAWHFYAAGLSTPQPGKTYQLWLINSDQKKISGGTFGVTARGEASLLAQAAPDAGRIVAVAVTDEPRGGVPQPTGQIQLVGQVQ